MDSKTTVSTLKRRVSRFRDERDWLKFHNAKDLSAAISIEAAELLEVFLWNNTLEAEMVRNDKRRFASVQEEMADITIYLLSLSDVLRIDLSDAVTAKLKRNAEKYPVSKSKGISKKYSEF